MALSSERYCDKPDGEEQAEEQAEKRGSIEEQPRSKMDREELQYNSDNLYVVDEIVGHVISGHWLKYVVR